MTTQPMAGVDYPAAIRLVLRSGSHRKTRSQVFCVELAGDVAFDRQTYAFREKGSLR